MSSASPFKFGDDAGFVLAARKMSGSGEQGCGAFAGMGAMITCIKARKHGEEESGLGAHIALAHSPRLYNLRQKRREKPSRRIMQATCGDADGSGTSSCNGSLMMNEL